ncbi:dihydrolipoamide dehydrogenase [Aneurinibacillus soli]|uniref:Dihydrolipoyl dehydrogenase n=1 Tax=Aneurinibacillus soli TaxID=1500254 RepID=A0A0U5BNG1_9BACL|nr:dihydrolipoyl dehydrogenase [Aneurinibacillus soli]PYE61942.1 dihydrolipoamide dehydrogenase [Aneurinibacillus soli]BAU29758.1 Dihydrolipoyl dehydrogenase [Aneurinibacillus soli]
MVVGEVVIETDIVVIGGGPGGYAAAIRLGQLGKSVVLVEKEELGGVCLNRGCIPSKALIHAAGEYAKLSRLAGIGITLPQGDIQFSLTAWQKHKQEIIGQLNRGVRQLCEKNGVTIVCGQAVFLSSDRIGVETGGDFETYRFEQAIIASGSRPMIPSFLSVDGTHILDSTDILALTEMPASVAIIGGGYIGMELGMALARLGCQVEIVEAEEDVLPQVASTFKKDVLRHAKQVGIHIHTGTRVENAVIENGRVQLHVKTMPGNAYTIESEKVLVTIGRVPHTEDLGLVQAGVQTDERGYILVDEQCRTNQPHIFAIGDCTPGPALAHRASKQGIVAAEVIGGLPSAVDSSFIPYVIFTEPQIAGVGLTREEAEQRGYVVKVGQFPVRANGRALATGEAEGIAEVIVEADSHLLLGFHMSGPDASNLIGEGVLALEMGARVEDIALTIHPHPTLSEVWLEAACAALGHAIHIVNK